MKLIARFLVFFQTFVLTLSNQLELEISFQSPDDDAVFIIQPASQSLDVLIKFSLGEYPTSVASVCFKVTSDIDDTELWQQTCFSPKESESGLTLFNAVPNRYRLTAFANGVVGEEIGPVIQRSFEVKKMADLAPELQILNENFVFVAQGEHEDAFVSVDYSLIERGVRLSAYLLCGRIDNFMDVVCFEISTQRTLSMNLPKGQYILELFFKDKLTNLHLETVKTIDIEVTVASPIINIEGNQVLVPPRFELLQNSFDLIVNDTTKYAELILPYFLEDPEQSFDPVDICIEIIDSVKLSVFASLACVQPSIPRIIAIQGLTEGQYKARIMLKSRKISDMFYPKSVNHFEIEARPVIEFTPTFDWQSVKPWHNIPIGLESRVVNNNVEVRIPLCYSCPEDQ